MPNTPLASHPLIGHTFVYRPDHPPYDPATDKTPGQVIVGNGHHVKILRAFRDWNGVKGLTVFYVFCEETGEHTHFSREELGITQATLYGCARMDCDRRAVVVYQGKTHPAIYGSCADHKPWENPADGKPKPLEDFKIIHGEP